MNCEEFLELLDDFSDGTLTKEKNAAMEKHLQSCPGCRNLYRIKNDLPHLYEDEQLPRDFSGKWKTALHAEERKEEHKVISFPQKMTRFLSVAAVLVFILGGTLLTRDSFHQPSNLPSPNLSMSDGLPSVVSEEPGQFSRQRTADAPADQENSREKVIRSASFTLSSANLDQVQKEITDSAVHLGGRVEQLSVSGQENRTVRMTLRIPQENLDQFLQGSKALGDVSQYSQSEEVVSDQYTDLEARLKIQTEKRDRLMELYTQAVSVPEIIEIENALSDTQYLIDSYTASLDQLDDRISFSQIHVTIKELSPAEDTNTSFFRRAAQALKNSLLAGFSFLKDVCLFVISILPWAAGLGVIGFIIRLIYKKARKHTGRKG